MSKISIRTNILSVFSLLVILVAFSLLGSQYFFSKKIAIESSKKTYQRITNIVTDHLKLEGDFTRNILTVKRKKSVFLKPITFEPIHPALVSIIQTLEIKKNIYAIYFTHKNGDFYEVVNMAENSALFDLYNAPKQAQWTIITNLNGQQQTAFLDKNLIQISKRVEPNKFDPRSRPWYQQAIASEAVITTAPYHFSNLNEAGITFAIELEVKGYVLAIDYTMDTLNALLGKQKLSNGSEVFIVNEKGYKYASSDFVNYSNKQNSDSTLLKLGSPLLDIFLDKKIEVIIDYNTDNNHYFIEFHKMEIKSSYLGFKVDADMLLKPYRDNLKYSFLIALILLLIIFPLVYLSSNQIVKPIKHLILENEKVKKRAYSEVNKIETSILELDDLSNSLVDMSQSIQNYEKSQEALLDAIIKLIAEAIDAKSPYTGGHCERVPEVAQLLLDEANNSKDDAFKNFSLNSKDALREFEIGAWLHDCGKVTTPEYVVDKSTKLETIYNRIHEVRMRFEVLWRDADIEYLTKKISLDDLHFKQKLLLSDFEFIASSNIGGEFMDESKQERIKSIANQEWQRHFDNKLGLGEVEYLRYSNDEIEKLPVTEKLLSDQLHHIVKRENFNYEAYKKEGFKEPVPEHLYNYGEVYNLCIAKGTLSPEERYKINEHVIMTLKMLEKIPFPNHLNNIPEYAGTHHETLIGTGYPRQLEAKDLSIPARIMVIADIFEALTASDRPYKKAKTLSQSIKIMSFMVKDKHIDEDLFKLFLTSGVYKKYAELYLKPEQIDEVDLKLYL